MASHGIEELDEPEDFQSSHEELTSDDNEYLGYQAMIGGDDDFEDEDDPDYQDDDGDDLDEEDDDDIFHDAEGGGDFEVEFVADDDEDDENQDPEDDDDNGLSVTGLFQRNILRILGGGGNSNIQIASDPSGRMMAILQGPGMRGLVFDNEEGDEDQAQGSNSRFRWRRQALDPNRFPKVPSDKGRELMESGCFGAFDLREPDSEKKSLARRILEREMRAGDRADRRRNEELIAQQMIPSPNPEMVIHYDDPVCFGQFSDDGNFFYAGGKDFRVHLYDTSNPYNWRHYKTATYPFGSWTLTDASLSPDNRWLAYSTLQSDVCFAPTDPSDTGDPYSLDLSEDTRTNRGGRERGFAIFSVKFSGDGRTIVAGTGAHSIVVYDIERRKVLHHVRGHDDDVNAVCFADKQSPHILYSGSDDCTIKVWDTRSVGDGREAGAFVGHIEGLTYIDSKGDGRYILSNGKDQSMKLWDLRMAMSSADYNRLDPLAPLRQLRHQFDYRWDAYEDDRWFALPHDNSLVTFRGHKVSRTLIRCHFSPPGSTDSRYVCSGSSDGAVYVWNLDASLKARVDVRAGVSKSLPPIQRRAWRRRVVGGRRRMFAADDDDDEEGGVNVLIRDVGWHPNAPLLVASTWHGASGHGAGSAALHAFNEGAEDEDEVVPMGRGINERLGKIVRPDVMEDLMEGS